MIKLKGGKNTKNDSYLKKAMGLSAGNIGRSAGMAKMLQGSQPTAAPVDPRTLPSIQPKSKVKLVRDSDEQMKKKKKKSKERNKENENYGTDSDSDSDFDFMGDDDSVLAALRAKRLGQLRAQGSKTLEFKAKGHGEYNTIVQDEFLPKVTASKYVVCHFFHRDFERCKIVDKHLRSLAPKHLATKFIRIDAEKTPFFIQKLQIRTLPTIVFFKDGLAIDRLVGFSELGGKDTFSTAAFEKRMLKIGMVGKAITSDDEESEDENDETYKSIRAGLHKNVITE